MRRSLAALPLARAAALRRVAHLWALRHLERGVAFDDDACPVADPDGQPEGVPLFLCIQEMCSPWKGGEGGLTRVFKSAPQSRLLGQTAKYNEEPGNEREEQRRTNASRAVFDRAKDDGGTAQAAQPPFSRGATPRAGSAKAAPRPLAWPSLSAR